MRIKKGRGKISPWVLGEVWDTKVINKQRRFTDQMVDLANLCRESSFSVGMVCALWKDQPQH